MCTTRRLWGQVCECDVCTTRILWGQVCGVSVMCVLLCVLIVGTSMWCECDVCTTREVCGVGVVSCYEWNVRIYSLDLLVLGLLCSCHVSPPHTHTFSSSSSLSRRTSYQPISHAISVVQWYPHDTGVFTSSSVDKTLRIWDTNQMMVVEKFSFSRLVYTHAMAVAESHSLIAGIGGVAMGVEREGVWVGCSGSR